jgi:FtsP/CotA-like multicopper oxidase with cupredoxin domain
MPPLFQGGDLVAAVSTAAIWPEATTNVWTLGGSYPAPTIRVRRGERFEARLVNQLDEPTNIHWHGVLVPSAMDGHPTDPVAPGATRDFSFVVDQRAGTFWYHPHVHLSTAKQVYRGMAGLFIVADDEEDRLALPSGAFEIPLVLQDRRIDVSRQFNYAPAMADTMSGYLGNTMLVNGTAEAYQTVSRDLYRLRVLNGSNARLLKLGFDDAASFNLIGSDGGLLERPYPVTTLMLAPAERVDILVDFSDLPVGSSRILRTLPYDNAPDATLQGWGMDIIRFDVASEAAGNAVVPTALSELELLTPAMAVAERSFFLGMNHGPGVMEHTINFKSYDMTRIDQRVTAGTVEQWVFDGSQADEPHPMHIHAAQFQVVARRGNPTNDPKDKGWKDTVIIPPFESARILVRFGAEAGLFVAHCHNLEHEDTGMMMNLMVEPSAGVESSVAEGSIGEITPNPANSGVEIPITVGTNALVSVGIYRTDGRFIRSAFTGRLRQGRHALGFDCSELPAGRYLVVLESALVRATRMLNVVR